MGTKVGTRAPRRVGAPRGLRVTAVTSRSVSLAWRAPAAGATPLGYVITRDGKTLARTSASTTTYVDHSVAPATRHSYVVRAIGAGKRLGPPTSPVHARTPKAGGSGSGGSGSGSGSGGSGSGSGGSGSGGSGSGSGSGGSGTGSGTGGKPGTTPDTQAPTVPGGVSATAQSDTAIQVSWNASSDNVGVAFYDVYRNGTLATSVTTTSFPDTGLAAGTTYSYTVSARDAAGNKSAKSSAASATTAVGPSLPATMNQAMVDRMFWRCGFGPTAADRTQWVGQPVTALVDHFLTTPQSYPASPYPPSYNGSSTIDPTATSDEMVIEWLYRMQTAANPFTERLTFFLSRHFAISTFEDAVPVEWVLAYRTRLYGAGDLAANPNAGFRQLAYEMTAQDGAMLYFLSGWLNVVGHPNENYAREFMELFTLGVQDASGNANYSQTDVEQLARCFTGWQLNQDPSSPSFGATSFSASYHDSATPAPVVLGHTLPGTAGAGGANDYQAACDVVLAQPSHAPFLITKLWHEFILAPVPPATLTDLVATYTADSRLLLAPLLRKILTHPLMFESIDEPNLIKPPVVYYVGLLKQIGAPLTDYFPRTALDDMQQIPYDPPNVAGWEGGLSWLNTSTCSARFSAVRDLMYLRFNGSGSGATDPTESHYVDTGGPGETAQQAYDRAYAAVGRPWISTQAQQILLAFAGDTTQFPANADVFARRRRQYALRAFMTAGPDAQVM